jgi:hypothetical protein
MELPVEFQFLFLAPDRLAIHYSSLIEHIVHI